MTIAGPDLSETALDGAAFDQPAPPEPPTRYFILGQRRSGSYMLCRALIRAGLGAPHEYFLSDHVQALAARWGVAAGRRLGPATTAYLDALIRHRSRAGFFGAKLQYWQYERMLASPAGDRLLDGARFIYLYRQDLLKQAISFRHAEITGRWGAASMITTKPLRREDPFDPVGVDRKLNLLIYDEVGWRSFMARRGIKALHLSYEELCADFRGTMIRIAAHLNAPIAAVEGLEAEPRSEQSGEDSELKHKMTETYLAARTPGGGRRFGPLGSGPADMLWAAWARGNGLDP